MGVERVLELMKEQGTPIPLPAPDVYAVVPDAAAMPVALRTLQELRDAGVRVQMHAGHAPMGLGSFKSQFKKADASGAALRADLRRRRTRARRGHREGAARRQRRAEPGRPARRDRGRLGRHPTILGAPTTD